MFAKFCRKCGTSLMPNPTANVPLPGEITFDPFTGKQQLVTEIDDNYLICSSGKCGHHGISHDYIYPGFWECLVGNDVVKCKRPHCNHTHIMYDGI